MRHAGPVAAVAATLLAVGATDLAAAGRWPAVTGLDDAGRIPGHYIVVLHPTTPVEDAVRRADRVSGVSVDDVYRSAVHGFSASMPLSAARTVAGFPGVHRVEADVRVRLTAQAMPTGVNRANADASPTAAINGRDQRVDVDVAVIDTGVGYAHPDLNVHRPGTYNCYRQAPNADDQHGHGTHVAGTIGALDNRIGVVGTAPGARIWPVRVLGPTGGGSMSEVICGIDYVTAHADRIDVANMSLGSPGGRDDGNCGRTYGDVMHQAICASVAAGVTYVVAAGNHGRDAAAFSPSSYDEVITVSALADFNGRPGGGAAPTCRTEVDDTLAGFSNYGHDIDLIAPGVCIRSTWKYGGYETLSGTSMASPHVTGAAALYLSRHPAASPGAVRAALRRTGSAAWSGVGDPDNLHEPLVDLTGY
ncbi:MAG: S8 family serine peptidase [Actinomycetota bacterium]|nr:S8 family serine peptidase [Actinomycetota bacterium]